MGDVNLADPAFEPTDAQLQELSVRAFAGLREARERRMARLRAQIEQERQAVMRALDARARERGG